VLILGPLFGEYLFVLILGPLFGEYLFVLILRVPLLLLDQFICAYSQGSLAVTRSVYLCLFSGPFLVSIYLWVPSESTSVT
jgi:hypothetical protein